MKTEIYINKIIEDTGLTKKDIQELVKKKNKELKGLISEEGALFIIAKELNVDIKDENIDALKDIEINITDINSNMKNVTLIGRIKDIFDVRSFNRKDGEVGYVGSFLLHDNTGDIRIVLWDDQVKIFEDPNFNINGLVKIINGNPKERQYQGFSGIEIQVGRFGKIVLSPEDVDYRRFPKITKKFIPIKDIKKSLQSVSIEGKIVQKFPINEFTRKNGERGKVCSLNLMDSTGTIRITFWGEDTEKLKGFEIDDVISITNLSPRENNRDPNIIELYARNSSVIKKESKTIDVSGEFVDKIKNLQNKQNIVSFQGLVSSIDNMKKITLKSGEDISLLSFVVSDDTDGIRITLWRDLADQYSEILKVGLGVSLKNVIVKFSSFNQRNEISFLTESKLEIIELKVDNLKSIEQTRKDVSSAFSGNYTKINDVNSSGFYEIKGFIAKELNKITIYEACSNCFKKIDNCSCEEKGEIEFRMIFNVIIDDESGTIRTTFIGDKAERLIGESTDLISKIKDTPDFTTFLANKSADLLGKDIVIKGKAKFSEFSNSYEMIVYNFQDLNINKELEMTINEIEM